MKKLLENHSDIQKFSENCEQASEDEKNNNLKRKWNHYKHFMDYIKKKTREATDPNNPANKAKKLLRFIHCPKFFLILK